MPLLNPLNEQHCNDINCVLQSVNNIAETIKACEECGLDMSKQKDLLDAQREFATRVKQIFMPMHP